MHALDRYSGAVYANMARARIPLSTPHFGQVSFWLFPLLSIPHPPTHLPTKKKSKLQFTRNISVVES